jgi:hypothetical protein
MAFVLSGCDLAFRSPSSAWTTKVNGGYRSGMGSTILSTSSARSSSMVEATPARTYAEVAATSTMNERTGRRFNLKPKRLAAVVGAGIAPHIPVWI